MRIRSDSLYILWPAGEKNGTKLNDDIRKASQKIKAILNNKYKKIGIFTGVGSVVPSISEVAKSYEEAQNALNFER
jgi:sugar diacid utilization regulator